MRRILTLAVIAGLLACGSPSEPDDGLQLGLISGFNLDDPRIDIPVSGATGEAVRVAISTYGGGCISKGETRIQRNGESTLITPLDRHSGGSVCTLELRVFEHVATLRFDVPGTKRIVIRGRGRSPDAELTIERTLLIH